MKQISKVVEEFSIKGWDIMLNAEGAGAGKYKSKARGLYSVVRKELTQTLQDRDKEWVERAKSWLASQDPTTQSPDYFKGATDLTLALTKTLQELNK